ncbi:MAG: hypothetical protein U0V74_15755 [Chitinophagales bacterium]
MKNKRVYDNMSQAELLVSTYLQKLNLWWEYEQPVFVLDDKDRPRVWTPDFYIPSLGMYIEVVGDGENPNYSWREAIYRKNQVPIIFITPFRMVQWQSYLIERINDMHQNRWEIIRKMSAVVM